MTKDKNYWKEYNQKRKARGYFQQNYLQKKGVVKSPEVVKNNLVVKSEIVVKSLQPEEVVKNESLQPATILQPKAEPIILQPPSCGLCPELSAKIKELKEQLEAVATLPAVYIDGLLEDERKKHRKEVESITKKLTKQIEQDRQTMQKLTTEKQQLIQKYSGVEKRSFVGDQNQAHSPTIPKNSNFISLFYSKDYKKFISHSCADSCWQGKYCNNCGSFAAVRP